MKLSIRLLGLILLLIGCEQEEIPIVAHEVGDLTTAAIDLGINYKYQVFYDISTNTEVSKNIKTIWDLGFECSAEGYHIKLNSSKAMQLYSTGETSFSSVTKIPEKGWSWDKPSGSVDSTAMGDWKNLKDEVYILDLGYSVEGTHLGYKKLMVISLKSEVYTIKYADLKESTSSTFLIQKDALYNFVFFSFDNGGEIVSVEPPKTDWDLQFTQYSHIFYDDTEPIFYLVTGVLHNIYSTFSYRDTIVGFDDFTYDNAQHSNYSSSANTVGYKWKKYNYDTGSYSIFSEYNYVLKTQKKEYYKIHFVDFYNSAGQKGTPTFEFQKL